MQIRTLHKTRPPQDLSRNKGGTKRSRHATHVQEERPKHAHFDYANDSFVVAAIRGYFVNIFSAH